MVDSTESFESSVIPYDSKTTDGDLTDFNAFESSVIPYDSKT